MPYPLYMSQIQTLATDFIQAGTSPAQLIPNTSYYFLVTGKASAGNGQSFLSLLGGLLTTSGNPGGTWIVSLDANYKVKINHTAGTFDVTMTDRIAFMLGFGLDERNLTGASYTLSAVPVTGVTAPYRSAWLWTPDMVISSTGPKLFDPAYSSGIKTGAGSAAFAPDNTASFVSNGVQIAAVHKFSGVQPYSNVRSLYDVVLNRQPTGDLETWWRFGPRLGSRILFWRNRSYLVGGYPPFVNSNLPLQYLEYYPDAALQKEPSIVASSEPNLYYWDVELGFRITERGDGIVY
jgi:hypothetical protein